VLLFPSGKGRAFGREKDKLMAMDDGVCSRGNLFGIGLKFEF
jgi:hypothetical protein